MKRFHIKLTGGIALIGQVKRPGDVIEVDEKLARQLLHRGKGELFNAEPPSQAAAEPVSEYMSMTVAQLRALLPDAPARANKAELIALAEATEAAAGEGEGKGEGGTDGA